MQGRDGRVVPVHSIENGALLLVGAISDIRMLLQHGCVRMNADSTRPRSSLSLTKPEAGMPGQLKPQASMTAQQRG